jgi:hypothetical protein
VSAVATVPLVSLTTTWLITAVAGHGGSVSTGQRLVTVVPWTPLPPAGGWVGPDAGEVCVGAVVGTTGVVALGDGARVIVR